ncbi:ATP-dependent sacrificial sulfur transferase LarE [Novisyntrophococcus fermenticellae]|uniref:ATP-dependent sacrificial sulfur transferase LarE n=1 Tax=Novisyntrophococcus fermenticellae TaxID=2068655 RepID=UPI001E5C0A8D|nr:ATP-dependent sacrificial sulfur transferase LarE [Novisyntrophococcus fermenticellae]
MTLHEFFNRNQNVAVAFSGGVDSSYLLYEAKNAGARVHAYFVKGAFQPEFELEDAKKVAEQTGVPMTILSVDVLSNETVTANPSNRCYYCKQTVFNLIKDTAKKDGFTILLDGTNASDDVADRPGMKALEELKVLSPLREAGLTKDEIRRRSKEYGLFTWDKPSYACLATRIPTNQKITKEELARVEHSESFLMGLGFSDFRIRTVGNIAKIQVKEAQLNKVLQHRALILKELLPLYQDVLLDLKVR